MDIVEFLQRVTDKYEDFYVTINKKRIFLKNNFSLIEKLLKQQEIYALVNKEIKAMIMIYREKGFRPYIKILAEDKDSATGLFKFLGWNFSDKEFYCKLKKDNPMTDVCLRNGFMSIGNRGSEILLIKKINRNRTYQLIPKD